MANANKPFGLAASRAQDGHNTGVLKQYYIPSTNAAKLYIGDPVTKTGTANTSAFLGHAAGSLPAVAKSTAAEQITGVIVGFLPDGEHFVTGPLAAGVEAVALVDDNLTKKFNIQANGTVAATIVGSNADIDVSGSGDDYTGLSGVTLDVSSADTTATLQLKIIGIADYLSNEVGDYSVLEVMINNDTEAHGSAGI